MRVRAFVAFLIDVPLKRPFRHASAVRSDSRNLVVQCQLEDGTTGWGEGVPRSYVTGETPEQCLVNLAATDLGSFFAGRDCGDWSSVIQMLTPFEPHVPVEDPRGIAGNALRCAVELSVLDAYGRLFGQPLSSAIDAVPAAATIKRAPHPVRYSTTIDSVSPSKARRKALAYRIYGFRHCKIKVGEDADTDVARVAMIRRWIGPKVDLRLDANEAWSVSELQNAIAPLLPYRIGCLEQPTSHESLKELASERSKIPVPIMLDESLCGWFDARRAVEWKACDLFNLRLSKCGGWIRCLELAAYARHHELGFQLGCHPGETGILSAAGRHWAQVVSDTRYLEGSYDRHLLKTNLIEEDITFGYGGRAPPLLGAGLGVQVHPQGLQAMTIQRQEFPLDG